jgi:hypothetical protein
MIGGYANERPLTPEHLKLPEALQRRVGQSIEVLHVSDDTVRYRNRLSGRVHTFRRFLTAWRWVKEVDG